MFNPLNAGNAGNARNARSAESAGNDPRFDASEKQNGH